MLKFSLFRDVLLKPLQNLVFIADKKHTIPILNSVLFVIKEGHLHIKVSDLETEIVNYIPLQQSSSDGEIAIPAKKLNDIIRTLSPDSLINFTQEVNNRISITCNKSNFKLAILNASAFPSINEDIQKSTFKLLFRHLISAIKRVKFSMANNDVRYFLNGMLWEIDRGYFRTVATDGHRMASSEILIQDTLLDMIQIIVPSKAIKEIERTSLISEDAEIKVQIGKNYFQVVSSGFQFTSKLIAGRFPDYTRIIPSNNNKLLIANRLELKQALIRTAILANEIYRGVKLKLCENNLILSANNPEHEQAQDQINVKYSDKLMEIGFNVNYLLNIIEVLDSENVNLYFDGPHMSLLIKDSKNCSTYVVSPIKL